MNQDEEEVVAFFQALPAARRREYERLAELDRRFGEDVEAERRSGEHGDASSEPTRGKS